MDDERLFSCRKSTTCTLAVIAMHVFVCVKCFSNIMYNLFVRQRTIFLHICILLQVFCNTIIPFCSTFITFFSTFITFCSILLHFPQLFLLFKNFHYIFPILWVKLCPQRFVFYIIFRRNEMV